MMNECEVVRDLMPLCADGVCSAGSRELVEKHIGECAECRRLYGRMMDDRIEENLRDEKQDVLGYGARRFRRRSAAVGTLIAGLFMIPVVVCLAVNLAQGAALSGFFVVLASLGVAAALVITPLMVPEDRLFWTFCAFCASLVLLLAVVYLVSGGRWFWIASGGALFGLSVIFLPFALRARPARRLLGGANRTLVILAVDGALFVNLMGAIAAQGGISFRSILLSLGTLAGFGLAALEIRNNGGKKA